MNHSSSTLETDYVQVINPNAQSPIVLVCEHASCFIPAELNNLGLSGDALTSHAAWDPGAMAVAQHLATHLNAKLVSSKVSRLVYDCNRPPTARDAMPEQSELFTIPGNRELSHTERAARVQRYYEPFRTALAQSVAATVEPVIVTIHSFTPIYHGAPRAVEIGVLHDSDSRLADAMLADTPFPAETLVERNEPYGPDHGVTHTLKEHALAGQHLNVMLEIRNDLIKTAQQQEEMARLVNIWITSALDRLHPKQAAQ